MAREARSPLRRFLFAGFLAPAAGGLWAGIFFSVLMATSGEAYQWPPTFVFMTAWASAYAAMIALLVTWTIGLAWHATACAKGWRSLAAYTGFGGGAATIVAIAIYLLSGSTWSTATGLGVLWFGSTGAVIGITGWLIRRPDRDAPDSPSEN